MALGLRRWGSVLLGPRGCCIGIMAYAALSGGCASVGQNSIATSALAPGKARIVLQRTNETLHATTPATAKVNGTKVADVAAGGIAVVDVVPGPVALSVESWSYPGRYSIPLEVRAGETVKVEIAPRLSKPSVVLGPIGGLVDKEENGNGGAFTVRQVANLDAVTSGVPPAKTQ